MTINRRSVFGCTTAIVLAFTASSVVVRAEDVKMFKQAPSVEELEKALGEGTSAKPKGKTRSIVFGDEAPPAQAPAENTAQPAPYQQAAPTQPTQPVQQPMAAAQPAPQPVPSAPAETQQAAVGFPINFDVNSASIRADAVPFLQSIAGLLQKNGTMRLQIEGHTDASGAYFHNMELSRARAYSVMNYLTAHFGIEPTRLQAVGFGPTQPLTGNPYSSENRRVQFRVIG